MFFREWMDKVYNIRFLNIKNFSGDAETRGNPKFYNAEQKWLKTGAPTLPQ